METTYKLYRDDSHSVLRATICGLDFACLQLTQATIKPSTLGWQLKSASWESARRRSDGMRAVISLDAEVVARHTRANTLYGSISELIETLGPQTDPKDAFEKVLSFYLGRFRHRVNEGMTTRAEGQMTVQQLCGLLSAHKMLKNNIPYAHFKLGAATGTVSIYTDPSEKITIDVWFYGNSWNREGFKLVCSDPEVLSEKVAEAEQDYLKTLSIARTIVTDEAANDDFDLEITIEGEQPSTALP